MEHFSLGGSARTYPRLPYEDIKNSILGRGYSLSLVFLGEKRAQALNKKTRNKTYTPNVLSFPLGKQSGEIYLTPQVAYREAQRYHHTKRGHVGYLYIHGLLHLKGLPHGTRMDQLEATYMRLFKLK